MIPSTANRLSRILSGAWAFLRTLVGDDAYDRYRADHSACPAGHPLLDRKAFYLQRQQRKWSGVNRCC